MEYYAATWNYVDPYLLILTWGDVQGILFGGGGWVIK